MRLAGSNSNRVIEAAVNPIDPLPGRTENVDLEFMTTWLERNKELQFVEAGLIQIVKNSDVKDASADLRQQKTGLEPLSTPKDDRVKGSDMQSVKPYAQ